MKLNLVGRVRSVKENGTECCGAHLDFQSPREREREKTPLLFINGESWITVSISTFIFFIYYYPV